MSWLGMKKLNTKQGVNVSMQTFNVTFKFCLKCQKCKYYHKLSFYITQSININGNHC